MKLREIVALSCLLLAKTSDARLVYGTAGDFWSGGMGARPLAMGGAFTAVADDVNAEWWNPSGLGFLEEKQITALYAPLPKLDSQIGYFAVGVPLREWGGLALSQATSRATGFEGRDDLNQPTGQDGAVMNQVLGISYGSRLGSYGALGIRGRWFQQRILNHSGGAYGLDLGAMSPSWHGMSVGLVASNLNKPSITLDQNPQTFQRVVRAGLSYRTWDDRLLLASDLNKTAGQNSYATLGLEVRPWSPLALRAGWNQNQDVTLGVGFRARQWMVDYAFANGDETGVFNQVSLTWRWGNIYRASLEPEGQAPGSKAIYLEGLRNELAFRVEKPIPKVTRWTLAISDVDHRLVRTLSSQYAPPEKLLWDMQDDSGRPVKRGEYRWLFTVEYKNGRLWTERGGFTLDFKTNVVPGVEIQSRERLEGLEVPTEAPSDASQGPAVLPPPGPPSSGPLPQEAPLTPDSKGQNP